MSAAMAERSLTDDEMAEVKKEVRSERGRADWRGEGEGEVAGLATGRIAASSGVLRGACCVGGRKCSARLLPVAEVSGPAGFLPL